MIAKLSGRVDSLTDGAAVIDVAGVGYLVFCSARTLARLAEDRPASLLVETQVREDAIHLYGFFDADERHWFRLLIALQGVGPKVALAILGVVSPSDLMLAIAASDRTALTRAAGVGAKLATRIITELKDKVAGLPSAKEASGGVAGAAGKPGGPTADAVSALVNLGFRPIDAQGAVAAAAGRLGPEPALEALIRGGLAELSGREQRT
jgi:Holliday junction DNA helicase RuvA